MTAASIEVRLLVPGQDHRTARAAAAPPACADSGGEPAERAARRLADRVYARRSVDRDVLDRRGSTRRGLQPLDVPVDQRAHGEQQFAQGGGTGASSGGTAGAPASSSAAAAQVAAAARSRCAARATPSRAAGRRRRRPRGLLRGPRARAGRRRRAPRRVRAQRVGVSASRPQPPKRTTRAPSANAPRRPVGRERAAAA